MYDNLPDIALSIMNPWAWLIVRGHKDIENRDWTTRFRGTIAVHAGKKLDRECSVELWAGRHPVTGAPVSYLLREAFSVGGIVGVVDIVDCVDRSNSEWFVGKHGFVLENARSVPFIPVRGALGFFKWKDNLL